MVVQPPRPKPWEKTYVLLPSYEKVKSDKVLYAHASRILHHETNPGCARALMQKHGERYIWVNPPAIPLSTEEMDSVFALPYKRVPHPSYGNSRIPAYEMIRFSINIMRGCFGGCSFTLVFMYLELNSTFLFLEFKLFIVIERYPFNVQQAC